MTNATQPAEIFEAIRQHLTSGNKKAVVAVGTQTRITVYKPKHAEMFRLSAKGDLLVQHGRGWNILAQAGCGALVSIRLGTM